jgi:signal transduction histidine kinase
MASSKTTQKIMTPVMLDQLKEIVSAVMFAAEGRTLEQVLERIAQVSKDLVNARYAALGVPDGKGGLTYFKVAGMTPEAIARLDHLPLGHGLIGAIMQERKTIRLERMTDDPRSVGFCAHHPKMTSLLGVPIQVGQQLFGVLYICDRLDGQPFTEDDEVLVETMAGYAALAIAGSQLRNQQSRLALLEERQRIAMELHDGVIQSLYAVGMHLELMRLSGGFENEDMVQIIHDLNRTIEDIRRYIMNLNNTDRHQKTVYECFAELVKRLHPPASMKFEIHAPHESPPFNSATFEAVCQMVNEALSNAIRHSAASVITLTTHLNKRRFQVIIADDGHGFDTTQLVNHTGLGLRNMQQRATLHGGEVVIETTPSRGTQLTISIPIREY